MRGLIGKLGLRGGAALGLALLVLLIVAIARVSSGDNRARYSSGPGLTITADPTAGDDGAVIPTPSTYPDGAAVRRAAERFAEAWLRRDLSAQAWHSGLAKLMTPALSRSLDGVDPTEVPATRLLGDPVLVLRTDHYAVLDLAVDTGTLKLSLLQDGDRWLVDGVDWERA